MSIHNRVSVTFGLLRPCLLTVVVLSTIWVHRWMPASAGEPVSGVEEFAWRETPASLALIRGQRVVWQLNHLQDGSERGVPYFHPLATVNGAVLTDLRPDDHLWHRVCASPGSKSMVWTVTGPGRKAWSSTRRLWDRRRSPPST